MTRCDKGMNGEDWKKLDRQYHEEPSVVESYDKRITNRYRIEHTYFTINLWIDEIKKAQKELILDFGCGTGSGTLKLLGEKIKTISTDASSTMLKFLSEKARKQGLNCQCVVSDVENLPFEDSLFDGIICVGVLHHIPNIERGVRSQVRVLKDD
jgi:ubiquinone/menaquinone biosynthesis C-methylase UbiE